MIRRRTDYKPSDMVRCSRCRRLAIKELAVKIEGRWYGSECKRIALNSSAQSVEDWMRAQLPKETEE